MSTSVPNVAPEHQRLQGIAADQFFYFYLRLRKNEIRRVVQRLRALHPGEGPEQLARRLIAAQSTLSFLSGVLIHLPLLSPATSRLLTFAGIAGGTSVLSSVHLYLILEIALLYDQNIDDQARIPEMLAVLAASGLVATAPVLLRRFRLAPLVSLPVSGLSVAAATRLIGEQAIRLYSERGPGAEKAPVPA